MRVVVTGATSMIGVALINECIANGCEVLAIVRKGTSRLSRLQNSPLIKIKECDFDSYDNMNIDDEYYDVFYHIAWGCTSRAERDFPLAQENNIRATLSAVELAHRLGCKKFIGAGSQAEYGLVDGVITPDTRPEPITTYGIAKLSANMLSRRMCELYKMTHIWGRIFSVYGTLDNDGTMINYAVDQFIKEEPAIFSAATQMWNYLNEKDAGKMFYLLGKSPAASGIYCIANQHSMPLRNYITALAQEYGNSAKCIFQPPSQEKMIGIQADISKTIEATDYIPTISFESGVREVIAFRKNGVIQ
ncbi:MAG: NAD(P)-dependent oxidoreductase [Ruminococcus sp.]|nr:NAD(P)-dependent oxidoreductase [Ruminococcus sp.]